MLLPSDSEAHRNVGDILEELDKAFEFVKGMTRDDFLNDNKTIYAVEKAIQNAIEACIQLEKKKHNKGQFTRLFPNISYAEIKDIADAGRHDYGNVDANLIWQELHGRLSKLHSRAAVLLNAKR